MGEEELVGRVNDIRNYKKFYIGEFLTLDAIAIRCASGDADQFAQTTAKVMETTDLPLLLCSLDPAVLGAGLAVAADRKPRSQSLHSHITSLLRSLRQTISMP